MRKTILLFGALVIALLVLFQLSSYSVITGDIGIELVIAVIAIVFFFVGVYINRRSLGRSRFANPADSKIDEQKISELGISKREYEILLKVSEGLSNKEIGEALYISESTIKTHVSSLFVKLNAKRRTQAIQIAKDLKIIR